MALSHDTLKAMMRDFHGFALSDEELGLVLFQSSIDRFGGLCSPVP
jgi:hypothetical protein